MTTVQLKFASKRTIRPRKESKPIWKDVIVSKPFCPKCDSLMHEMANMDSTFYRYRCSNDKCRYMC